MQGQRVTLVPLTVGLLIAAAPTASAQITDQCNFMDVPGVVWWGTSSQMTMGQLAAYLGPVYWFSPDEPLLRGTIAETIMLPQALPFETTPEGPVVYYEFEELVSVSAEETSLRNVPRGDVTPFTRAPSAS